MTNILNLLGPIVVGIAMAGVLLFLKRVLKLPLPGWAIPVGAAVAIFGTHMSNEYTWYSRFVAELPPTIEVVESHTTSGMFEPWTYLKPRINRFSAIDANSIKVNPAFPDYAIGEVILVERYVPTAKITQIADCKGSRTADLTATTQFGEDGLPIGVTWIDREAGNPILATLCRLAAEKQGG